MNVTSKSSWQTSARGHACICTCPLVYVHPGCPLAAWLRSQWGACRGDLDQAESAPCPHGGCSRCIYATGISTGYDVGIRAEPLVQHLQCPAEHCQGAPETGPVGAARLPLSGRTWGRAGTGASSPGTRTQLEVSPCLPASGQHPALGLPGVGTPAGSSVPDSGPSSSETRIESEFLLLSILKIMATNTGFLKSSPAGKTPDGETEFKIKELGPPPAP